MTLCGVGFVICCHGDVILYPGGTLSPALTSSIALSPTTPQGAAETSASIAPSTYIQLPEFSDVGEVAAALPAEGLFFIAVLVLTLRLLQVVLFFSCHPFCFTVISCFHDIMLSYSNL
jgi:hypothetical protein